MSGRQGMRGKGKRRGGLIPIDMAECRVRWPRQGYVGGPWWWWCCARWSGQHAARDARGPTWRESARRLGSQVDGSGTDGAIRQEMAALAIERGRD